MKNTSFVRLLVLFATSLCGVVSGNAAVREQLRFSSRDGQQSLALRPDAQVFRAMKMRTPRGAKTVFFGTCRGKLRRDGEAKAGKLAVHFYAIQTRRIKVGEYYQRKFALYCDVFSVARPRRSIKLFRLQNLSLNDKLKCINGNWALGDDAISGANFLWLDTTQNVPILHVKMSGTSITGFAGCDALLLFPKGLRAQPAVQDFENYMTTSEELRTFFTDRDQRGFLSVRQQQIYVESDYDRQKTIEHRAKPAYFDWNGKAFVARRSMTKNRSR